MNKHSVTRHLKKVISQIVSKALICIGLTLIPAISAAETSIVFKSVEQMRISELWLNPGFYSCHFQKNKGLNNSNFGLGGEYRYSAVSSVTLGIFNNSGRQTSRYVGLYWQPLTFGTVRFGAVVTAIDGYSMRNGGWFIAALPAASIEHKRIGVNLFYIPSYKDEISGSLSLQLKLRMF